MKHYSYTLHTVFLAGISFLSFTAQAASEAVSIDTKTDRISYAIGADIGHNFKNLNIALNPDALTQGLKDTLKGNKMLMDPKDIQSTLIDFQKELMSKKQSQLQDAGEKNKQEGEKFLADNKTKPGIITLPDGLQYKIIKTGAGDSPKDTDSVTVNYEGTFINKQVFDSSYTKGIPVTFPVTGVIAGWTEALKMMKPGAEWIIYVPSDLAYGNRHVGPIGPNQTLIFKVELISVQAASSDKSIKKSQ